MLTTVRNTRRLIIFFISYMVISTAYASKEGMLTWSNFSIESAGIGSSGAIKVSGTQTDDSIVSLRVNAFGREITLNSTQLNKLKNFPVNGMHLSFENDIWKKQHKILYVIISKGFTSGMDERKLIEIDNWGNVSITDM